MNSSRLLRHAPWLLGLCVLGYALIASGIPHVSQPLATRGVLDLRDVELWQRDIRLNGEWAWTWQHLRRPGGVVGPVEYVTFPQLWNHSTWQGKPLAGQGYATYALTVLLPPGGDPVALALPDAYTSYRLFVNGRELAHDGSPGTSRETTTPHWSSQLITVSAPGDTLQMVFQMANFQHSKGGPNEPILLGSPERLQQSRAVAQALYFFLAGCLFMGGLFFLGLFLFGRRDRSILYFSVFCLLYSYRIVGTREYVLHTLFPALPWSLTLHLEYLSLFLSIGTFVLYTRSLYPDDANPILARGMAGVCFGFAALTLLAPPTVFTLLVTPFSGLMFAYIAYAGYVYWLAVRRQRPGARYALLSTALLLGVFAAINLEYFGVASPENALLFVGYVGFFFLQSLVLSFRFANTLQKAREQAEEGLRAKSEFLSTMSHEIRTPLNAILGMTHLLLVENPRPKQKEQLDVMLFSANNLLTIVNDILDYTKLEAGKITFEEIPTDLAALARNVVTSYQIPAREKGLQLRLALDPALNGPVLGDPTRTAQVIANLVHNAIKFTTRGGVEVRLKVEAQTERQATLTISVADTGIGIEPAQQKLIFDRFTQADSSVARSFGGTGLGLAICKRLLEEQGSTLHLISEPGRGSTFFFTQTFARLSAPAEVSRMAPSLAPDARPLDGLRLLLVDDSPMNILAAKGILSRWGAVVDVATNGQEAIECLDPTRHQVVLMDLHMPVMDGYEATRYLRQRGETLPIIALTASLAREVEREARATGLNDVVVKPFKPDELLGVLLRYV